jgi:hypothetical protein
MRKPWDSTVSLTPQSTLRLNWRRRGVTLAPIIRKPFDILAEGLLVQSSRENKTAIEFFRCAIECLEQSVRAML